MSRDTSGRPPVGTDPSSEPTLDLPPDAPPAFGRYRNLEKIGQGGMAAVYRAEAVGPAGFEKPVAVKRILPEVAQDPQFRKWFAREAKLAVNLGHPNIVRVYDLLLEGPDLVIEMELVKGTDLGSLIDAAAKKGKTLPTAVSAWICREACQGLDYAHKAKDSRERPLSIVHRDI